MGTRSEKSIAEPFFYELLEQCSHERKHCFIIFKICCADALTAGQRVVFPETCLYAALLHEEELEGEGRRIVVSPHPGEEYVEHALLEHEDQRNGEALHGLDDEIRIDAAEHLEVVIDLI